MVGFLLCLHFDFFQKKWLFAYFWIPIKIALRCKFWRFQMCLKVKYSVAEDLLQRADKICRALGPRGGMENWLLVQINQCSTASSPLSTYPFLLSPYWARSGRGARRAIFVLHSSELTLSLASSQAAWATPWASSSSSSMSSVSGSPTMACEVCPMSCVSSCWLLLTQPWLQFVTHHFVLLPTAVLVLYFKYFLQWDDNLSTAIYHTFVALCYLTPILGALVADSWLGKFKWVVP